MRSAASLWMLLLASLLLGARPVDAPGQDWVSKETIGRCLIQAEGYSYSLHPCIYYYFSHTSDTTHGRVTDMSLEFRQNRPRNYYVRFGHIHFDDSSRRAGDGDWNGPNIRNLHGDHDVGKMHRVANCWLNATAKFCFWPMPPER